MAKTRVVKTIASSLQNLPAPIAALATQFGTLPAVWTLSIAAGAGLLATYRELAENRGEELLSYIEEHKDEFVDTIVNSPEFIAVFVNVWELHIRETAENKRRRLRQFLLSIGSGKPVPQDTHTKIYGVIQQMTDQEAVVFGILINNTNRAQYRNMHVNQTSIPGLNAYADDVIKDTWHSLHAYRLVDVADDGVVGGIMSLKQITPFGELFYDFVLDTAST